MNRVYVIIFAVLLIPRVSIAQHFVGGYWVVDSIKIINIEGDTKPFYVRNGDNNFMDYSNVKTQFNPNGTFVGDNILGEPAKGGFNIISDDFVKIVSRVYEYKFIDNNTLELKYSESMKSPYDDQYYDVVTYELNKRINDCIELASHKNSTILPDTYISDRIISNSKAAEGGGGIKYYASKFVELLPGFDSKESLFEADIRQCPYE